jgi:hypothetical protein
MNNKNIDMNNILNEIDLSELNLKQIFFIDFIQKKYEICSYNRTTNDMVITLKYGKMFYTITYINSEYFKLLIWDKIYTICSMEIKIIDNLCIILNILIKNNTISFLQYYSEFNNEIKIKDNLSYIIINSYYYYIVNDEKYIKFNTINGNVSKIFKHNGIIKLKK